MAYVSTWGRDGVSAELGGSRRVVYRREVCAVPGCVRPVGAAGDGCAKCRSAYETVIGFGERTQVRVECWLCGGHASVAGGTCSDCAPVTNGLSPAAGAGSRFASTVEVVPVPLIG